MAKSVSTVERTTQPVSSRGIWAILGFCLLVRIIYFWHFINSPLYGLYRADHQFYREWAKSIAEGKLLRDQVFEQGPLYAYITGIFYNIMGTSDRFLFALQMGVGLLTIWLVYKIGCMVFDVWTGRIAALMCGLYGPLMFYETMVMKTCLTPFLTVAFAYGIVRSRSSIRPGRWLSLSAICAGLLMLIRENYILLIPVLCTASWVFSSASLRKRFFQAITLVFLTILVTLPATIHNYLVSSKLIWVTSGGGEVLYMGWGPEANGYYKPPNFIRPNPIYEHEDFRLEASRRLGHAVPHEEASRFWTKSALWEVYSYPLRSLQLLVLKSAIMLNDFEVPDSSHFAAYQSFVPILNYLLTFGWVLGFLVVGLFSPSQDQTLRRFLIAVILVSVLGILLTYNFGRFRLGIMPLAILFSASGVMMVIRGLSSDRLQQQAKALCGCLAAIILSMTAFFPPVGFIEAGFPTLIKEVSEKIERRKQMLDELSAFQRNFLSIRNPENKQRLEYVNHLLSAQLFDQAQQELELIIRDEPENVQALSTLAGLHGLLGHLEKAEKFLLQALRVQPDQVDLWANLGNVYFHRALQGTVSSQERVSALYAAQDAYEKGLTIDSENLTCLQGVAGVKQSLMLDQE